MYRTLIVFVFFAVLAGSVMGQSSSPVPGPVQAKTTDVASQDAIVRALYEVISGGPGEKRDWDRFRSLFVPSARMGAAVKLGNGQVHYFGVDVESYIKMNDKAITEKGFYEREIHRHADTFGNISQLFSTFESRIKPDDKKPFERGVNSIQLLDDGVRWWIVSIFWQSEDDQVFLPLRWLRG